MLNFAYICYVKVNKKYEMRNLIAIIVLIFGVTANAQNGDIQINNGKYFTLSGGLFTGVYEQFTDGVKTSEMEVKNGVLSGSALYFHTNGALREEGSYAEGKRAGAWTQYNSLGKVISSASFKNDEKHGKWMIWDDSGNMRFEMYYNEGQKIGEWKMWDEEGKLTVKVFEQ